MKPVVTCFCFFFLSPSLWLLKLAKTVSKTPELPYFALKLALIEHVQR